MSLDCLHFYLVLVSAALLGVGRRDRLSSHTFTPSLWRGWNLPIGFFTRYSNTFDICLRWLLGCVQYGQSLEDSATFLRVLFCLWRFWRGFWGCWRFFSDCSCAKWLVCPIHSVQGSPLLWLGCKLFYRSSGSASVVSCLSLSSLWW